MDKQQRRDFDAAAAGWDENPRRRQLAAAIAGGIQAVIGPDAQMTALEYGSGTGLVGLQLAADLGHLTAADSSSGMLLELAKKRDALGLTNVTPCLVAEDRWLFAAASFDLVVASMVLHHIPDTAGILRHFVQVLKPGGFLALADLAKEDGSFHDDPTGVAHHGLVPETLVTLLAELGCRKLATRTVHTIAKQRGDREQHYPVFLLTGQKPR